MVYSKEIINLLIGGQLFLNIKNNRGSMKISEIKSMWKHNPLASVITLLGAVIILLTVFLSDYYNVRNFYLTAIVFNGTVMMLAGAWIYIFYSPIKQTNKIKHLI